MPKPLALEDFGNATQDEQMDTTNFNLLNIYDMKVTLTLFPPYYARYQKEHEELS